MSRTENRRINVFINGKQVKNEVGDMAKQYAILNNKIKGMTIGSKQYNATVAKMRTLKTNLRQHNQNLRGVQSRWSKLGSMASAYGPAVIAAMAGRAVVSAIRESIALFRQQEKAVAKVEQAIKSTAGAAGRDLQQLKKAASDLQEGTLFGDEDILNNVTAQLLTFTNIAEDEFDRTQAVALDLATVLDGDLKSASIQLGKALNDPVGNLSALSRSGIQFSEDQKAVIKELANTNRLAEAQQVILSELERQYGGQAAAAAKVDGGLTQLSNRFGDLLENVGRFVMQGLRPLIEAADQGLDVLIPMFDSVDFGSEALQEQRVEMNALVSVMENGQITLEQEREARDRLNQIIGPYTDKVITEKTTKEQLRDIQQEVNAGLLEEIAIKAKAEIIQERMNKVDQEQKRLFEAQLELQKFNQTGEAGFLATVGSIGTTIAGNRVSPGEILALEVISAEKALEEANQEVIELQNNFGDLGAILQQAQGGGVNPNPIPNAATEDPKVSQENVRAEQIKAIRIQLNNELLQVENRRVEAELAIGESAGQRIMDQQDAVTKNAIRSKEEELRATGAYANGVFNIMGNLGTLAGESAAYQQELALFQNAVNGGLAITQAAASVKAGDPLTYLALLGTVIGVITSTVGQAKAMSESAAPPPPPAFARGTDSAPGGLSLVGEEGPELVNLPAGSGVTPAGPTRNLIFGSNAQPNFAAVPDLSGASAGGGMGMIQELRAMREQMSHWQSTLRVEQVQTDVDRYDERRNRNLRRVESVQN
ncbi:MAG: hypothetical protein V2I33_18330 [Kangiellaceae bacterium]|nr:hypothetical protein [Kangiellaceae bacterium]